VPERSEKEGEPIPEAHNVQVTRQVKHPARKKKFGARDRLAEIISEAERMWGKPVIRPFDAEEDGKSLPLRVKNLLKRGMRMLAPPKIKFSSKKLWKKILLGLLHQSVQELPHPPAMTGKWGMPPLKNHAQLLIRPKPKWEHPREKIPKSQEVLSKRVFRIHRVLVLK
jgi:hypothetical protein